METPKNTRMGLERKTDPDDIDRMIMEKLKAYPPATVREIGLAINRTHVAVTLRMKWLEQKGYIKHADGVPKGSGRAKILTVQGFQHLGEYD